MIVDGESYAPTKVTPSGTYHFETPDSNPSQAEFPLRNQVWEGHGSEHLPCPNGIHWISNENVLTVSHCLSGSTTTTTSEPPVTTTVPPSTTSTTTSPSIPTTSVVPSSTSTVPAPTTSNVPTTSAPTPSSSVEPTTTVSVTLPPTTTQVAVTTPPVPTTVTIPDPLDVPELPATGSSGIAAGIAAMLVGVGITLYLIARRNRVQSGDSEGL